MSSFHSSAYVDVHNLPVDTVVYVGIDDRATFDAIGLIEMAHPNGCLSKAIWSERNGPRTDVIFLHWPSRHVEPTSIAPAAPIACEVSP